MALALRLMLPVLEGLAPAGNDAVGVMLTVVLPLLVVLAVLDAVPVPVGVGEPVAVPVGVWLPVALPLSEMLPVLEALAPDVSEPVGDAEVVELALTVVLAVLDAVPVPVGVGEPVGVPVPESLPVALAEAPGVSEGVGGALAVLLLLNEGDGVAVELPAAVGAALGLGEMVCVPDGEPNDGGVADPLAPGDNV